MARPLKPSFASPRVVVIGAGLMGLWPAVHLAEAGCAVTVLEAGKPARGASWAAAGMLAPASEAGEGATDTPSILGAFGIHSLALWRDWAGRFDSAGHDICWRPSGSLQSAFDEDGVQTLERRRRAALALGMTARMLSADTARRLEPELADGLHAALLIEDEASVDPRLVLTALQALLADAGGALQSGVMVKAVESSGGALRICCADGRRLAADKVVLATGFAAGAVAGMEELVQRIAPVKGQMLALATGAKLGPVIRDARAYIVPRGHGRVVIGATSEPGKADNSTDDETIAGLHRGAAAVVPVLARASIAERWAGVRPHSRDGLPLIGALGVPGVFANCGHYRNGVLLAPASAAMLSALVLEQQGSPFDEALRPAR